MGLNEYIKNQEDLVEQKKIIYTNVQEILSLKARLKKVEFKFYREVIGIDVSEIDELKELKKKTPRLFKFINRNVPFGAIKKLLNSGNSKQSFI